MGNFLRITYDSQGGRTTATAFKDQEVLDYIVDGLKDDNWQNSIVHKLNNVDPKYSHISLGTILRFFLPENIQAGNLNSLVRYVKKDDKLIIDHMLNIDNYETLSEEETRAALCDDIFEYFSSVILKYKDRFLDFDAVTFIPLFKERIEFIKKGKYVSYRVKSV